MDCFGTSWDGTFWKLSSGSPVFWVLSDPSINLPYWQTFYQPALIPYKHYIPVHLAQLSAYIDTAAAEKNDKEFERIGMDTAEVNACVYYTI